MLAEVVGRTKTRVEQEYLDRCATKVAEEWLRQEAEVKPVVIGCAEICRPTSFWPAADRDH
jgi:hypothetical protein